MESEHAVKDRETFFFRFYPNHLMCKTCNKRSQCISGKASKCFRIKKEYMESTPLRELMRKKLISKKGIRNYSDRACTVEHVFGNIKEHFSFTKFFFRKIVNVEAVWNIACIAYNFRRMSNMGHL